MKTSQSRYLIPVLAISAALLSGGCGRKGPASGAAFKTSGQSAPVAAQTNSFDEVAAYLEPGGSFYVFLDTQPWLEGLSRKIEDLRQVLLTLPNTKAADRDNLRKLIDLGSGLVRTSGLEAVSGFGASGILMEPGIYRHRLVLHHYPGQDQGLLWSAFGKTPHALTGLDLLPETTALASFSDLDLAALWKAVKAQAEQANLPEVTQGLEQLSDGLGAKLGLNLDEIAAALGGEAGVVLTLDPDRLVTLPAPGGGRLEFPEPALALVLRVNSDDLFARVDTLLSKNKQVVRQDEGALKMRILPLPLPLPFQVRPTVASDGVYLFVATTDKLVRKMLEVRGGAKGLKSHAEFARIAKGIPQQGNRFTYVSPEISRTVTHLVHTIAAMQHQAGKADGGTELLERLLGDDEETFLYSVASNTKDGWVGISHSTRPPGAGLLGPSTVPIAAAVVLPAIAKARQRSRSVACLGNLKQISLAARLYADKHGGVLPPDFLSMKAELNTPRILVCPADPAKPAAQDWDSFDVTTSSYEIVAPGADMSDPKKVYVRCRIHGSVGLVDGSVEQRPRMKNR
ncbi:MAG: hypothetical protein JXQ71_08120 [Verrucomicrobia bacterium]|nr:hypothetical protein [Verrucomicrobiota bacterium]